jgi:hypothetical protein
MRFLKLLVHDIKEGTLRKWYKYFIVVFIVYFNCRDLHEGIAQGINIGELNSSGTCMDYILYMMRGMEVYIFSSDKHFSIPIYWFAFQIGIACIIAYYPENDFKYMGNQMMMASKSRDNWWISKCMWCILTVIFYFVVMVGSTVVLAQIYGAKIDFNFTEDITTVFFGTNTQYMQNRDAMFLAVILPCIVTICISLVQILLSFLISSVVSFALVCGLYVTSAYYTNPVFLGNYTMWLRSTYFDASGVNCEIGVLIAVILTIGSVFIGSIYFDKCDII